MTRSSRTESRAQRASRRSNNAAAAAACGDNNSTSSDKGRQKSERTKSKRKDESNNQGGNPPQNDIIGAFYSMLQQGAPQQQQFGNDNFEDIQIDMQIAANVLEAAAGNLSLAMTLYWDHYFVSQANNNRADDHPNNNNDGLDHKLPAAGGQNRQDENQGMDDDESESFWDVKDPVSRRRNRRSNRSSRNNPCIKNLKRSYLDNEASPPPKRRLRRSLDSDFRAAEENTEKKEKHKRTKKNNACNNNDVKMPAARLNKNREEESDGYSDADHDEEESKSDANVGRPLRVHGFRRRQGDHGRIVVHDAQAEASISVSDDEDLMKRKKSNQRKNLSRVSSSKLNHVISSARRAAILKAAESISRKKRKVLPNQLSKNLYQSSEQRKERRRSRYDTNVGNDHDDDHKDYISDNDWLETYSESLKPSEALWGKLVLPSSSCLPSNVQNDNVDNIIKNGNEEGHVVAQDDDEIRVLREEEEAPVSQNSSDDARSVASKAVSSTVGIPYTWLNACFELSEDCGSGLVIKSPNVEDIEFFKWRQQQVNDRRNSVPPPYHCKSLTAITSIVTAMLYTGASIQGEEVNCTSGKPNWASLTPEERKREFESRLVDALSALIYVAAKASLKRKHKAYQKVLRANSSTNDNIEVKTEANQKKELQKKSNGDNDGSDGTTNVLTNEKKMTLKNKKEQMRRRLRLIPTCVWSDNEVAAKARSADGPLYNYNIKTKISWTNIRDIQLYVKGNMEAFTTRGGIALFLETLISIHGNNVIERQLKSIHKLSGDLCKTVSPLICCTCEERQKIMNEDKPIPLSVRIDPRKLLDTTPPSTDCASVQLLTLILTGNTQKDWKSCSTEGLGFGLLTENNDEVGQSLARPLKPVWLLQGDCYSVLSLEGHLGSKSSSQLPGMKTISKVDQPRISMQFFHWNGWYGQRRKSGMRLITPAEKSAPSSKKLLSQLSDRHRDRRAADTKLLLMERRRHESLVNAISTNEHKSYEARERKNQILPSELANVKIHNDDQRLYPQNHCMWRFDLSYDEGDNTSTEDQKQRAENWIPYFRLTSRQKKIIEIKLGPKISKILRTRWPEGKIDNFSPSDGRFPIV